MDLTTTLNTTLTTLIPLLNLLQTDDNSLVTTTATTTAITATDNSNDLLPVDAFDPFAINVVDQYLGIYNNFTNNDDNISMEAFNATANATTTGRSTLGPVYAAVEKFVVPAVCATGIVLNVLNLLVLTERGLQESPYTYLSAMAVLCLTSLSLSFLSYALMHAFKNNYYAFVYTFHLYYPCVNICANSTMWLTAMLTIERFLFVRHPLWARAMCDRRSAKMKICAIIVLMILNNIPRFLMYKVVLNKDRTPGNYTFAYTAFRSSQTYEVISWINSVTIQLIPMAILCVFNSYLVYAVHGARRLRQRLEIRNNMEAEWSREQTRLTVTLISIVFFFILCIMPSAFADLHVAFALFGGDLTRDQFRVSSGYITLQKVSNLLVFCQLSFNFILYSAFNDKFLAVFKKMLKRWSSRLLGKRRGGGKGSGRGSGSRGCGGGGGERGGMGGGGGGGSSKKSLTGSNVTTTTSNGSNHTSANTNMCSSSSSSSSMLRLLRLDTVRAVGGGGGGGGGEGEEEKRALNNNPNYTLCTSPDDFGGVGRDRIKVKGRNRVKDGVKDGGEDAAMTMTALLESAS